MSKTIPLTQGKETIVDDADFEWLNQWKWHYRSEGHGYAGRSIVQKGKRKTLYMHRLILNPPTEMVSHHINTNGLDNRRCNLRFCTISQNGMNRRKQPGCTSKYKGVCWHKGASKWGAHIKTGSKLCHLGLFETEKEAAFAYNAVATAYFGEFARLNVIDEA